MTQWKKVKIGDVCKIVKGTTGIQLLHNILKDAFGEG